MNKQEKTIAILLGLCLAGWLWYSVTEQKKAAEAARECGLGLNAGHDLSLENLKYFAERIEWCDEVSIGHALISDALYLGLENTVQLYRRCLKDE